MSPEETFERAPGAADRCVHCERSEREHTWRCDGCGEALYWPPWQKFPALHVSIFPELHPLSSGATLYCDHASAN